MFNYSMHRSVINLAVFLCFTLLFFALICSHWVVLIKVLRRVINQSKYKDHGKKSNTQASNCHQTEELQKRQSLVIWVVTSTQVDFKGVLDFFLLVKLTKSSANVRNDDPSSKSTPLICIIQNLIVGGGLSLSFSTLFCIDHRAGVIKSLKGKKDERIHFLPAFTF